MFECIRELNRVLLEKQEDKTKGKQEKKIFLHKHTKGFTSVHRFQMRKWWFPGLYTNNVSGTGPKSLGVDTLQSLWQMSTLYHKSSQTKPLLALPSFMLDFSGLEAVGIYHLHCLFTKSHTNYKITQGR